VRALPSAVWQELSYSINHNRNLVLDKSLLGTAWRVGLWDELGQYVARHEDSAMTAFIAGVPGPQQPSVWQLSGFVLRPGIQV